MRFANSAVFIVLLCAPISIAFSKENSIYVPLEAQSCRVLNGPVNYRYLSRSLEVSECPTKIRIQSTILRLFVVSTDERSWVDLALGSTIWSSEDEVVYEKENQFGYFPNVGNAPVEIRMNDAGNAMGLIFRVTAQASNQEFSDLGISNISRLFVLGFKETGICFLGIARDNIMAHKLLDSGTVCKRMLKVEHLE